MSALQPRVGLLHRNRLKGLEHYPRGAGGGGHRSHSYVVRPALYFDCPLAGHILALAHSTTYQGPRVKWVLHCGHYQTIVLILSTHAGPVGHPGFINQPINVTSVAMKFMHKHGFACQAA
jgi:hypothetical protein